MNPSDQITVLLGRMRDGEDAVRDELFGLLYRELRVLADAACRKGPQGLSLQPTAVVHEAYLKIAPEGHRDWQHRGEFFAFAAKSMRHLLTDYARAKSRDKRGGAWQRVTLEKVLDQDTTNTLDFVAVDEALNKLASLDPKQASVVELRFFAGMTLEEIAEVQGLSFYTVRDHWRGARAWLRLQLEKEIPE